MGTALQWNRWIASPAVELPESDRLEFERIFLWLKLSLLLAPCLLIVAYGAPAIRPAAEVDIAVLLDCGFVQVLLARYPEFALSTQLVLRVLDLAVAYIALHFVHVFVGNAYYDSVYLLFVVAATATHGSKGTYWISALAALAVLLGRLQLIADGVLTFQVRHVTDALFYALLFLITGAITQFLMRKTAEVVALRDRQAAEAIRESEERYRGLFENATDIVYVHDLEGRFLAVNRAGEALTGYSHDDITGLTIADVIAPSDLDRAREMTQWKLTGKSATTYELSLIGKDGRRIDVEVSSQIIERGGVPVAVQGIARNITQRKLWEDQLRFRALHDGLTGLPNRSLFHDRLAQTVAAAHRTHAPFAVALLDLDGFKEVNDTLGHSYGDSVLRHLGTVLVGTLRESDTIARLGGDEFALLLPGTDGSGAQTACAGLLSIMSQPCAVEGHQFALRASIGIALYPKHGTSAGMLLEKADAAMYLAKRRQSGFALYVESREESEGPTLRHLG